MLVVENTILSDELVEKFFVCNIEKCKGACCVEGDLGAPLEEEELKIFDQIYEEVLPYMTEEGKAEVEKQGKYVKDYEADWSTPLLEGGECVYAKYDEKGFLKCAVEEAYYDKKITYKKPISCHLYPIRIDKFKNYDALNYDRWDICSDACDLGTELSVPVYKFAKDSLIRKYGEDWYNKVELEIEQRKNELGK